MLPAFFDCTSQEAEVRHPLRDGVPCPHMTDFGSIWKTIREVDILAIRHEAEHDVIV